jgi:hypothetical protein
MGIDNDIYSALSAGWVIATIAKPSFHLNPDAPRPQTRHLYIQAQFQGTLESVEADNLADDRIINFELTGYEGSEDDCIKCIKVIKKVLHSTSVTAGHYHIDSFQIIEVNQLKSYVLKGHQYKQVEYDDF